MALRVFIVRCCRVGGPQKVGWGGNWQLTAAAPTTAWLCLTACAWVGLREMPSRPCPKRPDMLLQLLLAS